VSSHFQVLLAFKYSVLPIFDSFLIFAFGYFLILAFDYFAKSDDVGVAQIYEFLELPAI